MCMSTEFNSVWRILDANHNRVAEGLRVVEEYLRFEVADQHLAGLLKGLRHDLQQTLQAAGGEKLVAARDTIGDVGQEVKAANEHGRQSVADLIGANWQRVQQGLRVLEEYTKLLPGETSQSVERLRYRAYTLAKATLVGRASQERLDACRLYVLVSVLESAEKFATTVKPLIESGVDVIQLRDKQATDRVLLSRAKQLRELTRDTPTLFIMNDRPDLAVLSDADGVHVGQDELSVAEVRRIVGPERLIGVSTHNLLQAKEAVLAGANYLGCGPTFASQTKTFDQFAGLNFLRQVAAEISLPAFAIGGINLANVAEVRAAGFSRIAVSAAVTQANDPAGAVKELKQRLND